MHHLEYYKFYVKQEGMLLTWFTINNLRFSNNRPDLVFVKVHLVIFLSVWIGKRRKRRVDDAAVAQMTKKLAACHINVSDISLEVRNLLFYI